MKKIIHEKNKKMRIATIISIIFSAMAILSFSINLIVYSNIENYFKEFDAFFDEFIPLNSNNMDMLRGYLYIALIVALVVIILINLIVFILSIYTLRKTKLEYKEFIKKRNIYITLIVLYGMDFIFINILSSLIFAVGSISNIAMIISFIFALIAISGSKEQIHVSYNQQRYGNDPFAKDEHGLSAYQENMEVQKQNNIVHESNVVHMQKELDDVFLEIANLEKSFKNNEIDTETYQRKKEELLNKLVK